MEVYTDFFMYSSGVYSPTNLARATIAGYHAVRILGWGQVGQVKSLWVERTINGKTLLDFEVVGQVHVPLEATQKSTI